MDVKAEEDRFKFFSFFFPYEVYKIFSSYNSSQREPVPTSQS